MNSNSTRTCSRLGSRVCCCTRRASWSCSRVISRLSTRNSPKSQSTACSSQLWLVLARRQEGVIRPFGAGVVEDAVAGAGGQGELAHPLLPVPGLQFPVYV